MSQTILYDDRTSAPASARVADGQLWLSPADCQQATGWKLEAQGLCRGDACVRTDPAWIDADGNINLTAFAAHMGQPLVRDATNAVWAFGESVNARRDQLFSLDAPEFSLPDIDGKLHALSDYRGKKVFLYSWGSY